MNTYLVISAIGTDKPGLIDKLSEQALTQGCNILDTRMTVLGGEFALLMMVGGTEDALTKLEPELHRCSESLGLTLVLKKTSPRALDQRSLPYHVDIVAMDNPGIVHEIASFFSNKSINIEEMETNTYAAAHTGTPMFALEMLVYIPANVAIGALKEEFLIFCDQKNLDASIEAARNTGQ